MNERDTDVTTAVATRDSEGLYRLAGVYKEEGEDEIAEALLAKARMVDKEDWAYDNSIGN